MPPWQLLDEFKLFLPNQLSMNGLGHEDFRFGGSDNIEDFEEFENPFADFENPLTNFENLFLV